MKKICTLKYMLVAAVCLTPSFAYADGESVPINYDNVSFFEEPLAAEVGPVTVSVNTLVDQSVEHSTQADKVRYNTQAVGDLVVETELPNTWQLKGEYVANYERLKKDSYDDDMAVSLSDEWGTVAVGNVTGSVFEHSRRKRGCGHAELSNDNFLGALDETGGFYSVEYNSYHFSVTADQEGRVEAGASFGRPIGKYDYFAGVRVRKADAGEDPGDTVTALNSPGDTYGTAVVGQVVYASFFADAQIAYENVDLDNQAGSNDHTFASVGAQYKDGAYRYSAEAGVGNYDGDERRAFALGSRIDIARGASINLGVNYTYENDDDDVTSIGSVRYEF